MDADLCTRFLNLIGELQHPEDVVTLRALREAIDQRLATIQFDLMLSWVQQGYSKNPPGLVCDACGAPTYGKQDGAVERIKCTSMLCGITRSVAVG